MFQETRSQAEIVAALSPEERAELFADFTEEQMDALMYDADFWLRPAQKIPDGDWFITALICGRGWGKTRAITEWIKKKALEEPGNLINSLPLLLHGRNVNTRARPGEVQRQFHLLLSTFFSATKE